MLLVPPKERLYLEVFFGAIQNLINVTGDLVTIAIEEKHVWNEQETHW